MQVSLWFIGFVLLLMLMVGGAIAWFLMGRRPTKLDPRHERIVQSLTRLHQDNPRKAMDLIARALVRGGLVWEADVQTQVQLTPLPGARSFAQARPGGQGEKSASASAGRGSQSQPEGGKASPGVQGRSSSQPAALASGNTSGDKQSTSGGAAKDAVSRQPRRRRRHQSKARAKDTTSRSNV
jgi:hypothetical protein